MHLSAASTLEQPVEKVTQRITVLMLSPFSERALGLWIDMFADLLALICHQPQVRDRYTQASRQTYQPQDEVPTH